MKEGESYSPSMRFDIHPYCRLSLAFCWCPFELLGGGLFGAKKSFPRETNAVTWMGLEARVQATSTRSPANQPMGPLHHYPYLKSEKIYKEKENWEKKLNSGGNNSDKNNSTIFLAFQSDFQNYSRLHDK